MVMRPKSKATVVVDLPGAPVGSSMPTPASVMVASVSSGRISLTERTIVVLPTPNPPTMTIFRPWLAVPSNGASARNGAGDGGGEDGESEIAVDGLETAESNKHLLEGGGIENQVVAEAPGSWMSHGDLARRQQVGEQHRGDADRQPQLGRDLHHRGGGAADAQDGRGFGGHARHGLGFSDHAGHQVES